MDLITSDAETPSSTAARPAPSRRPFHRRVMHVVRRGHLYLGLFLFPWAVLYGATAFLFNHPTAFSDQPTATFGAEALVGTPMESCPSPQEQAEAVVAKLNEAQKPTTPYTLAGDARYAREFAFATVKADGQTISVLFDVRNGGGTIRSSPSVERREPEKAPFATGSAGPPGGGRGGPSGGGRGAGGPAARRGDGLKLDQPLHERVRAAVPTVLERCGFATGEVTVTSVPDVVFPLDADGRTWTATYSPMTGAVSGTTEAAPPSELSWRRFLLRLHTAHGYPGEANGRWFWAVVVDVMAFVMCFWGVSGLFMWWQLKATRRVGLLVLLLSAVAATVLGFVMHDALTG